MSAVPAAAPYLCCIVGTRAARLMVALILLGCGEAVVGPVTSPVEGVWAGSITGDAQDGTLEWRLTEADGVVTGEGSLSTASASIALVIEGIYERPALTLTMHPQGFEDIVFAGTVGDRIIKGRMSGAGLINRTVTLDRQP